MFLQTPPDSEAATRLYQQDIASRGHVMNLSRAWAWRPDVEAAFAGLRSLLTSNSNLTSRERAVLVCSAASSLGDAYCSLAWGTMLAAASDGGAAAAILMGEDAAGLAPREMALARWARQVARDPNSTAAKDVESLRAVGLSDKEIFEATVFVAFRIAFSTVNDALGVHPDWQVAQAAPPEVRDAVTYGRASEPQGISGSVQA